MESRNVKDQINRYLTNRMSTYESSTYDAEDIALETVLMQVNLKRRAGARVKPNSPTLKRRDSVEFFLESQ